MIQRMLHTMARICLICLLTVAFGGAGAGAETPAALTAIPQIDSSTARIPITSAIYALLQDEYQLAGPEPMCSKTHGAWLNLADHKADILFTVAPTQDEFAYFQDKGVQIEMKVFGYDGLVFIGNGENPVENLGSDQIRAIYGGEITDWSAIDGGENAPIDAYIRNPESGSQRLFEQLVWAGYDMPDFVALGLREGEIESVASAFKVTRYVGMEGIVEGIALNEHSIGFNIMSFVDDKYLNSEESFFYSGQMLRATGELNLRSGPGLSYKRRGLMSKGEELPYLDVEEKDERGVYWFKVLHPTAGEVWASSRYSTFETVLASKLKLFSVDGFAPSTEHFASGDYPFVTTSIVAIRSDEPQSSPARQLFDWVGSEQSRALIAENSTLAVSFSDPFVYTGSIGPDAQ